MKVRAIITGATGMVGEGVLHECLLSDDVEQVLVINRKPCGVVHPKLKEIIHSNFHDFSPIEPQLQNYNAAFFCLGVTSVGKKEPEYTELTYDLTKHVADSIVKYNHDMVCCYVSGGGTDSTEKGKIMWARVKGRTENYLLHLPFKAAYMFRPGFIKATPGLKNTLKLYAYFGWLYPILKTFFPKHVCTLRELGLAMVHTVTKGYDKHILDSEDIVALAQ
ncbi:MAG TPA: hypothetical protein VK718_00300 [Ferruginibacter sp.]|nr:hypothetical protein [Ferruginibacter sp.]